MTGAGVDCQRAPKSAGNTERRTRLWGLLQRRERWSLSWRGWLIGGAGVLGVGLCIGLGSHPFLAMTHRVDAEYLVVEGWVPNYALEESIAEFKSRPYRLMFTVGCEIVNGVNVEEGDNHADYSASRLRWLGMDMKLVQPVHARVKYRNRTYESALALRRWIQDHQLPVASFNVVTVGPHARRSRLLFEKAFGGKAKVGVIAVEDREYDPRRWWKYSEGVKELIAEGAAYLYARFFFVGAKAE
jgi:hypothetical protein